MKKNVLLIVDDQTVVTGVMPMAGRRLPEERLKVAPTGGEAERLSQAKRTKELKDRQHQRGAGARQLKDKTVKAHFTLTAADQPNLEADYPGGG